MLIDKEKNPVRKQRYEAQIEYHNLNCTVRGLKKALKQWTNNAQRRKMAYCKKRLTLKNRQDRFQHCFRNLHLTVKGTFSRIHYTDEAHFDPSTERTERVLREDGTRYEPENLQCKGRRTGNILHFAGWVTYFNKCEELKFYNDEEAIK